MAHEKFDLLIRNVRVVRPNSSEISLQHIAVKDGRFAAIGPQLAAEEAAAVTDAKGMLGFPGLVDAHMHTGIYNPIAEDALRESRAAAQGGVTSSLNYFRSGQYYMNRGGPYAELFPELLELSGGRFHVDYAYHLAPMDGQEIGEIEMLIEKYGVTSFKIFMFYGGYGLHGASGHQHDFLMIGPEEKYDLAHFEFVMRGIRRAMERFPQRRPYISLSMHCETAEIMAAYTKLVQQEGRLTGLRAYSAARPPHSEGLAITIASYLAQETECLNINLLHLSSRKAVEAALAMQTAFPQIDFRREVTIAHLCIDYDVKTGVLAKVNPPIRSREDVEFLWKSLLEGRIDWVCSDHACCRHEMKVDGSRPGDVFLAKSGFGGTEYLLSALMTEGRRRGLSYNRIAELTSWNPAQRFGLLQKGDIAPGFDADLVLVDPDRSFVVRAAESESGQGYTPFEGLELSATVMSTYLRGDCIYQDGKVIGAPRGRYLHRPCPGRGS
ncbi:MAG TPA: dihydroorotase family protein [Steroidobacteraceae bacterium]|nr:dihydroorotase family protein [Steroidobacteraceae bacterium]